jgi:hypothetical protein
VIGVPAHLHVLLEGTTEERIHEEIFRGHWEAQGWAVSGSVVTTARRGSTPAFRGGVSTWAKLQQEIREALRARHFAVVTTVVDYYGAPSDLPGMTTRPVGGSARERVEHVEAAMADEIGDRRFIPHLTLHEIEAWVLAATESLAELAGDERLRRRLDVIVDGAGGPENVNDGPSTAPSKRLLGLWPRYDKTLDGPIAIAELGLEALRSRCPHLDAWLGEIERTLRKI